MDNTVLDPEITGIKEEILDGSENDEKEAENPLDKSKEGEQNLNFTEFFQNVMLAPEDFPKLKPARTKRRFVKVREIEEMRKKIQEKAYILTPKEGARSDAWKKFQMVVDAVTGQKTDFVQCICCNSLRRYSGTTTGTSQLLRHSCETPKDGPYVGATKQCMKTMLKSLVEFCAMDMQPLEILEGPGFEKLGQTLIDLGSKSGRLRIEDVMPAHSTLAKQVLQEAETAKQDLFMTILPHIRNEEGAISLNTWTDERTSISYTNVTFHYIDENWTYNSCLLFTIYLPEKRNTIDNIRNKILRKLMSLGASKDFSQLITFVSDQSAEEVDRLKSYNHIPCAEVSFNRVVENLLCSQFTERETPKIHHTLSGLNSFVKFLTESGLSSHLPKPIRILEKENWREQLQALTLIVQQSKEIFELVKGLQHSNWFLNFNVVVAQELVDFLKLFDEAIDDLKVDRKPNLHLVLLWHKKISNYCTEREDNSIEMKNFKKRAEITLNSLFPIDYRHKIATFLWPSVRKMKMLSDAEKSQFMQQLQIELSAMGLEEERDTEDPLADDEPPEKLRKTHFDQWMEAPGEAEILNDEITKYLMSRPSNNEAKLLTWWKQNEIKLPKLANLAKKYLCIPATKRYSEKLFEPAKVLLKGRPTEMEPAKVVSLNFLHETYNSM